MKLTDQQKREYYLKRKLVRQYILNWARRNKVTIYGASGLNLQLPPQFRSITRDVDMYTKNPKVSAHQLEKHLDEVLGGDYFSVEPAQYPHTYKIKSRVTSKTRADLTRPKSKIHFRYVNGQKVASIKQIIKNRKASLKNPDSKFRHPKDKEALQRIRLSKKPVQNGGGFGMPALKSWTTQLPMTFNKGKKEKISLW